ncbi:MAG: 23S rRNA (guanosine(2251)-2'-O)-methyltransferase RlmB [Microbacteriaceae bacterium]|nr:23S rRNA (guanosine(2251)-2'-O)-methyltransferase RlmB [Microbacteriaceae bacterium]
MKGQPKQRPGVGKAKTRVGKQVGSGGQGRQALEGKGPTPKAEDRPYHVAFKKKQLKERSQAKQEAREKSRAGRLASFSEDGVSSNRKRTVKPISGKSSKPGVDTPEMMGGRNSVVEALRAEIPVIALYIARGIETDERVKEILDTANARGISILEVTRVELDRLCGRDAVHQGVALKVPPYVYAHPDDLLALAKRKGKTPLFVALDSVTDPRNLGAIVRSAAAFGAQGVIIPQRRSAGMTASAWKTSAGAATRVPVAMSSNLNNTVKSMQKQGVFVIGLDGDGDVNLPELELATSPLMIIVGSEGKGLSRLVRESCDAIVSIPIDKATESLNAAVATSVALYQVATMRKSSSSK